MPDPIKHSHLKKWPAPFDGVGSHAGDRMVQARSALGHRMIRVQWVLHGMQRCQPMTGTTIPDLSEHW